MTAAGVLSMLSDPWTWILMYLPYISGYSEFHYLLHLDQNFWSFLEGSLVQHQLSKCLSSLSGHSLFTTVIISIYSPILILNIHNFLYMSADQTYWNYQLSINLSHTLFSGNHLANPSLCASFYIGIQALFHTFWMHLELLRLLSVVLLSPQLIYYTGLHN